MTGPDDRAILLPATIRAAILAHAVGEAPLEACGLVIGDRSPFAGGRALRFVPTSNALASPYRFEIEPRELVRLTLETDAADEVFWAIVHSHVRSEARPSATDVANARYPESLYLVVGPVEDADAADVRGWRIASGVATEVPLAEA